MKEKQTSGRREFLKASAVGAAAAALPAGARAAARVEERRQTGVALVPRRQKAFYDIGAVQSLQRNNVADRRQRDDIQPCQQIERILVPGTGFCWRVWMLGHTESY